MGGRGPLPSPFAEHFPDLERHLRSLIRRHPPGGTGTGPHGPNWICPATAAAPSLQPRSPPRGVNDALGFCSLARASASAKTSSIVFMRSPTGRAEAGPSGWDMVGRLAAVENRARGRPAATNNILDQHIRFLGPPSRRRGIEATNQRDGANGRRASGSALQVPVESRRQAMAAIMSIRRPRS